MRPVRLGETGEGRIILEYWVALVYTVFFFPGAQQRNEMKLQQEPDVLIHLLQG